MWSNVLRLLLITMLVISVPMNFRPLRDSIYGVKDYMIGVDNDEAEAAEERSSRLSVKSDAQKSAEVERSGLSSSGEILPARAGSHLL